MPIFDFKCPQCGQHGERILQSWQTGATCDRCGTEMQKLPPAPSFRIHGFSAQNGYAKT